MEEGLKCFVDCQAPDHGDGEAPGVVGVAAPQEEGESKQSDEGDAERATERGEGVEGGCRGVGRRSCVTQREKLLSREVISLGEDFFA